MSYPQEQRSLDNDISDNFWWPSEYDVKYSSNLPESALSVTHMVFLLSQ